MRYISTHILFVSRTLALVTFLASSGFTAILHNCTLVPASCCAAPREINHKDCSESLPVNLERSIQSNAVCHTNTVVGGITTNPAVLEKVVKSEVKKPVSPLFVLSPFVAVSGQSFTSSTPFSSPASVFLPSVEKYVLNASFLI
jgi:hypothetical protein